MSETTTELARIEITHEHDAHGQRTVTVTATRPDGTTPEIYDLHALLSVALTTITTPEWADLYDHD